MDVLKKTPVREQDPKVRATNFEEVCLGYNKEEAVEEAAVELELPPHAASRPAAPTAPVTFRKSRREIALLIFVLLLIQKTLFTALSAKGSLYTIMITKETGKRKM